MQIFNKVTHRIREKPKHKIRLSFSNKVSRHARLLGDRRKNSYSLFFSLNFSANSSKSASSVETSSQNVTFSVQNDL